MRRIPTTLVALTLVCVIASVAWAALRTVSMIDFDFIDDATGSTERIVINQGDQIQFTLKSQGPAATPHSVDIDELGVSSGDLQINGRNTYTTPPINKVGTFRVYCKRHFQRGHETTLQVNSTTASSPAPSPLPKSGPGTTASPTAPGTISNTLSPSPGSSAPASSDTAINELAPTGLGSNADAIIDVSPAPDSLAGILGRRPTPRGPWTRSLLLAAATGIPLMAAAALAWNRERRRKLPEQSLE